MLAHWFSHTILRWLRVGAISFKDCSPLFLPFSPSSVLCFLSHGVYKNGFVQADPGMSVAAAVLYPKTIAMKILQQTSNWAGTVLVTRLIEFGFIDAG